MIIHAINLTTGYPRLFLTISNQPQKDNFMFQNTPLKNFVTRLKKQTHRYTIIGGNLLIPLVFLLCNESLLLNLVSFCAFR